MSEGGDAGVDWTHKPTPFPFQLGARYRPAPATTPRLMASAVLTDAAVPRTCRWDENLDLTGEDGLPDALGNDVLSNCVPCAALRQMQLWAGDGRKPTREQADTLFEEWGGTPYGTFTDTAFDRWGRRGFYWSDQRQIVPRWTVLEADGVAPNLLNLKRGIHALGGVIGCFRMCQAAMNLERWEQPNPGTPEAEDMGGHCVLIAGYDMTAFYVVSWGHVIPVGYAFLMARLQQASAFAANAWVRPDGKTPSGLTFDEIKSIGAVIEGV